MKQIVYMPADITVNLPNEQDLIDYCISRSVEHPYNVKRGLVIPVGCRDDLTPWKFVMDFHSIRFDRNVVTDDMSQQFRDSLAGVKFNSFEDLYWEPKFKSLFPSLIDAVKQMPWKHINCVFVTLVGEAQSELHKDPDTDWGGPEAGWSLITPERYNIMLTCHETPVMVWSNGIETVNPTIERAHPCYVFNNSQFLHGSTVPDERTIGKRIQLVVHGVLDDRLHIDMLKRSIEKFPDKIVWLEVNDKLQDTNYKHITDFYDQRH